MKKLLLVVLLGVFLYGNNCNDTLMDLKITKDDVKLSSLIKGLAKDCGYSVFYQDGGEKINNKLVGLISFEKRTPDEILDFLLHQYNFNYTLENKILTISEIATRTFKVDFLDTTRTSSSSVNVDIGAGGDGGSESGGSTGASIDIEEKFDFWETLESDIGNILSVSSSEESSESNKVIINSKAGFVTVTGTYKQLSEVENYVNKLLDTLKKQVLIDVKIISVLLDDSYQTGINWNQLSFGFSSDGGKTETKTSGGAYTAPSAGGTTTTSGGTTTTAASITLPTVNSWVVNQGVFNAQGFFNFLTKYGKTKSLSSPKILTMNNQPSLVSIGDNINYLRKTSTTSDGGAVAESTEIEELFIGVLLDITPQIDDNGFVTLRINPSISEFKYSEDAVKQTVSRDLPPDTVTRRISSVVRVKDGDVVILGGLISSSKSDTENKVPLLGDIPFLGRLFKSNTVTDVTTEIVFVLTPRLLMDDKKPTLGDLGYKIQLDEKGFLKEETKEEPEEEEEQEESEL